MSTETQPQHDAAGWRNIPKSSKPLDQAKIAKLLAKEWETFEAATKASGVHNAKAKKSLPMGVTSSFQHWDPYPISIKSAKGAYVTDVDGRKLLDLSMGFGAMMVGASVSLGWGLTAWHAGWSFDVVPIKSVSFTGPSADTLMGLINMPQIPLTFDIGIVMGVFAGSGSAAWLSGQFKMQTFDASTGLSRYLIGAVLMGFGGMLAGGCAVGAGVSGGSIMASTAWLALLFMWLSAGITDRLIDRAA